MNPVDLLDAALRAIRAHQADAQTHGLLLVGVTGSVARLEAGAHSDVDIVYEIAGRPTLFDLGGVQMDLQDELGRPVDLVDLAEVKPALKETMERDLVRA